MVSFYALSIFLLHVVTVFGSQFWHDVDTLLNELSSARDLPTEWTTNEAQQLVPRRSPSPNEMDQNQLESQGSLIRKNIRKRVTVTGPDGQSLNYVEKRVSFMPHDIRHFKAALKIDNSYPKNISSAVVEDRLNKLKDVQEWSNLRKYNVKKYSRYWAKVCVSLWDKELDSSHRQSCMVSPSYGLYKKKKLFLSGRLLHFDLLVCKCHSYITNYVQPESAADTFLIYQMSVNEYTIFKQRETNNCQYTLFLKDFKGGIILPDPDAFNN